MGNYSLISLVTILLRMLICCRHYFSLVCHDALIAQHSTQQGTFRLKGDQQNPEMATADLKEVTKQPPGSLRCRLDICRTATCRPGVEYLNRTDTLSEK